jgi:4-amino-4-deoxychorismate lyase
MKTWKNNGLIWMDCEMLPLADRGFRYGMSVFETIAVHDGKLLFLEPHLQRLKHAAADCGCVLPELPDFNLLPLGTGLLRIYLTAGAGAPEAPFTGNAYALFDEAEVGWNLSPLRVALHAAPCMPRPGGWKTGNYWQNIDALVASRCIGCDEALVCNPAGMLMGAAMANVFLLIDGSWVTPTLETGARNGVVREWVLDTLGAAESLLDADEALRCSSAFVTNSRVGIRPIGELNGRPLVDSTSILQQRYFDEIFTS